MSVAYTTLVEALLSAVWTDITDDVLLGWNLTYGIDGNRPDSLTADSGVFSFTLRNDANNSGKKQGYYTPRHANCRAGWSFGVQIRTTLTHNAVPTVKHYGKVQVINPTFGRYGDQRVKVTSYDTMYDLLKASAKRVTLQTDKRGSELIGQVLDAVATSVQPLARDIDVTEDVFPIAFDKLGSGVKALSLIKDLTVSSLARTFVKGNGTFRVMNRTSQQTIASSASFDNTMIDLSAPSSSEKLWNSVVVTTHPKKVSPTAVDELYVMPTGTSLAIAAGQTIDVWTAYTDPDNRSVQIGGLDIVDPLVGGTHYTANSLADGSGTNRTSNISADIDPFASTAKVSLTNNGPEAFITLIKVIGRAVKDPGPQHYEKESAEMYGEQVLEIDLPYQDDGELAQQFANYLAEFSGFYNQIDNQMILASTNTTLMAQALAREPGDGVTVTEFMTGITLLKAVIQRVALSQNTDGVLYCKWDLAPGSPFTPWQLGIVGASELGTTTLLGL